VPKSLRRDGRRDWREASGRSELRPAWRRDARAARGGVGGGPKPGRNSFSEEL